MFAIDLFDFGRGGADFASILKRGRISKSLRTPVLSRLSSYILLDFLNKSHLITQLVMRYLWSNLTLYGAVLPPHLILLFVWIG